jgi:NitT/TauT family transport system permease protein
MGVGQRFLTAANFLFVLFLLIQLLPDQTQNNSFAAYSVWFVVGLEVFFLAVSGFIKKSEGLTLLKDIFFFIFAVFILWVLFTAKFNILREVLFPAPGIVLKQFVDDFPKISENVISSLSIIGKGYLLAMLLAVPLGLFLGWSVRLGNAATYISKFLSSIPPIVYIPYAIALLSSLQDARVFVIFLASFWPTFAATMSGVLNVEKKVIESAKALNVGKLSMLFNIILPAALPQVFIGCNQGLGISFIMLTSAEMIGGKSGLGYYVKYYSDFGDYKRLIVGIIVIGIVITVITFFFNKLQRYLLRWRH